MIAGWSEKPGPAAELARLARPLAQRVADDTPDVMRAIGQGDLHAAQSAALEAVAGESEPARREARRTGCAWALSRLDNGGAEPLFGDSRDGGRHGEVSDILQIALHEGRRPWEIALAAKLFRHVDPAFRLAAIGAQIRAARTSGLPVAAMRRLVEAALAEPQAGRFQQDFAELIWTSRLHGLVQPVFGRFHSLIEAARDDPLPAYLLRAAAWHRAPAPHRRLILASAERLARVEDATRGFWRRLADRELRIAVVGNSPCEEGRSRGPEIDRHAMVIRFNDSPEDGRFAADYGARCDAKVLAVRNTQRPTMRTSAPCVVFRRQRHVVHSKMALTERFQGGGAEVVYIPAALTQDLRARLGRPASTGLAFLAQIRAVRGSLANVSCFGFSMTDQIERGARSHYFDREIAFEGHAWRAERALFEAWTAER